jgi:AcrR family transcriptional regulator
MNETRRQKQRAAVNEEIKEVARRLMVEQGTAGVSLRAIARQMDMSAPALYHYFANREALITALIVDAFNALADHVEQAREAAGSRPLGERLMAVLLAYRQWALANPVDFELIYGNPIPGYDAPQEVTAPAAARGLAALAELIAEVGQGRGPAAEEYQVIPPELEPFFQALQKREGYDAPLLALYLAAVAWSRVHGILMLELVNQLQPLVGDGELFYRSQVEAMLRGMGLKG